jgi:hypothetical protein
MNLDSFTKEELWEIVVEAVHAHVMYPTHKAYTRDVILQDKPDVSAKDLALQLNMSLGEALVIMDELVGMEKQE